MFGVYAIGENWYGALGIGDNPDLSDDELFPIPLPDDINEVKAVAAGWGHTAFVIELRETKENKLFVCGMPHDFRGLLRLNRLPGVLRSAALSMSKILSPSLPNDTSSTSENESLKTSSILYTMSPVSVQQEKDTPSGIIAASAGLTAFVGKEKGTLYCFGVNSYGQCGVGASSVNVWEPSPVCGLNSTILPFWEGYKRKHLVQEAPIVDIKLGLQHCLALDANGILYSFGKNERSQLGQVSANDDSEGTVSAMIKYDPFQAYADVVQGFENEEIVQIAAGFNHSAVRCRSGKVFVWGKNMYNASDATHVMKEFDKPNLADVTIPKEVIGLPSNKKVIEITCGSHHTSMLLDDGSIWAVGIASDKPQLIDEAVQLLEVGNLTLPVQQFEAFFDRTIVVSNHGIDVLELKLMSSPVTANEWSLCSIPEWLQDLGPNERVRSVHCGWKHSIILTK